jgi:response regulator NasT
VEGATGLRVLAADEDERALAQTVATLESLGHRVTASAIELPAAIEAVVREDPDLSIVVAHDDDEHALGLVEEIESFSRGPVIALVTSLDAEFARRAAARGIYACVREADAAALRDAIEVTMHRHAERRELEQQIHRLESALERRAVIERAKGILMERHGIGDRDAFDRLRAHARSTNRTVVDVAATVCDGHTLLN